MYKITNICINLFMYYFKLYDAKRILPQKPLQSSCVRGPCYACYISMYTRTLGWM